MSWIIALFAYLTAFACLTIGLGFALARLFRAEPGDEDHREEGSQGGTSAGATSGGSRGNNGRPNRSPDDFRAAVQITRA